MKLLIDMNISPDWCDVFRRHGWEAIHWSEVGDPRAADQIIMAWARDNGYVLFTHDLDFGAMLAITKARGPSVFQIRTQDVMPGHLEKLVVDILSKHQREIEAGALVVADEARLRVRLLPLTP